MFNQINLPDKVKVQILQQKVTQKDNEIESLQKKLFEIKELLVQLINYYIDLSPYERNCILFELQNLVEKDTYTKIDVTESFLVQPYTSNFKEK